VFVVLAAGKDVVYDQNAVIEDVRGGVSLKVTYPPNLVDTLDGGVI